MELLSTRFEVENEVENLYRHSQKVAVSLGYFITREMDSNPRSPVGETDVGYPARPLRDAGCSSMLEAPRTARSRC